MSILIRGMEMPTNCDNCLFDNSIDYIWCSENDMCYDVEHYCKDGVKKDEID